MGKTSQSSPCRINIRKLPNWSKKSEKWIFSHCINSRNSLNHRRKRIIFTILLGIKNHSLQHSNHGSSEVSPHLLANPHTLPQHKPHPSTTPGQGVPKLHTVHGCMQSRCWRFYHPWHEPCPILGMLVQISAGQTGRNDHCGHSYRKSEHQ